MSEYRYYQNGVDVTWYVERGLKTPMSERFFKIERKLIQTTDINDIDISEIKA